jgi:phosphoglycolate phosphatase-like HAD superfamily hydrolase
MDQPLESWNDGPAKSAILAFIRSVTEPGPDFVEPADRIATFDNDGTLWCEKPMYVQADFVLRRWGEMVKADPSKATEQPYKAVVERDLAWLGALEQHVPELLKGMGEAFGGITVDAFEAEVRAFFEAARHPTLGRAYTDVGYAPMIELLDLLRANGFKVFICTGGGRDFVRPVSDTMYGIPRESIIGSAAMLEYRDGDLYRTAGVEQPIDDGPGKPVHIFNRTGRRPLLAGGNSDGDIAMLETARFALLVHHDDADREFAYDKGTEHALEEARARGWTVISMKDDFGTVFPDASVPAVPGVRA